MATLELTREQARYNKIAIRIATKVIQAAKAGDYTCQQILNESERE
jgi:hypothetical protein